MMPNHPEHWDGSPEFERDEPEPEYTVCEWCGCEQDSLPSGVAVRRMHHFWEFCDRCNGWEDGA